MKEKVCDLWLEPADYRCIPISGARAADGAAIMDSGIPLQAKKRFRDIEYDLGRLLASRGNHVHLLRPGLLSFPVKQFQWSALSLEVVERSALELCALVGDMKTLLPRPTQGEQTVPWEEVAKILSFLPDNILVISHG